LQLLNALQREKQILCLYKKRKCLKILVKIIQKLLTSKIVLVKIFDGWVVERKLGVFI